MTSEPTTTIVPIITKDAQHVFTNTMEYQSISSYFTTDDFANFAADAEVDRDMLVSVSEGLTNFLRNQSVNNQTLNWAGKAVAVCTHASVADVIDTENVKVMFIIDIRSNA